MNSQYVKPFINRSLIGALALSTSFLGGCFNSSSDSGASGELPITDSGIYFDITSVNYAAISVDPSEAYLEPGARLLAAQCAQCHGTYGVAVRDWPDLWGGGRKIGKAMVDYQNEEVYRDNMMYVHALAYTPEEVNLLKSYYPKVTYQPSTVGEQP